MSSCLHVFTLSVLLLLMTVSSLAAENRCGELREPLCQHLVYNVTMLPNILGHETAEAAGEALPEWLRELPQDSTCSEDARELLCFAFFPPCTLLDQPIPPCREMCEKARRSCDGVVSSFGYRWPDELDCDRLPSRGGLCIGTTETTTATSSAAAAVVVVPPTFAEASSSSTEATSTSTAAPSTPAAASTSMARPSTSTSGPSTSTARPSGSTTPAPFHILWSHLSSTGRPDAATESSGEPSCPCAPGGKGTIPAPLRRLMSTLPRLERIAQLQEENMLLQQQKMRLEIQLLELNLLNLRKLDRD